MSKFFGKYFSKQVGSVTVKVDLIEYQEDDIHYVYSPALDLVGYGKMAAAARESWEVVLQEYFKYAINKNTLEADLTSRGWKQSKKNYQPPTFDWLLKNNNELSDVFNNHDFQKISRPISVPLVACA